uniref:Uncharacterized protein n=1 Tax=Daphnia magna TaxID=35525 RepID=A0A0P6BH62_9CRUS
MNATLFQKPPWRRLHRFVAHLSFYTSSASLCSTFLILHDCKFSFSLSLFSPFCLTTSGHATRIGSVVLTAVA